MGYNNIIESGRKEYEAKVKNLEGIFKKIEKILLGFASGVMMAASVWSLIIPSIYNLFSYNLS